MTNKWRPAKWVLLRYYLKNNSTFDRLLVSSQSRYTEQEGWRLSEALQSAKYNGYEISFRTQDGEVYECRPDREGMTELTESVLPEIKHEASLIHGASVSVIDYAGEEK